MAGAAAGRRTGDASCAADDAGGVEAAAEVLRAGGVVVVPTDTVYGLAARPEDPDAVRARLPGEGPAPGHARCPCWRRRSNRSGRSGST